MNHSTVYVDSAIIAEFLDSQSENCNSKNSQDISESSQDISSFANYYITQKNLIDNILNKISANPSIVGGAA